MVDEYRRTDQSDSDVTLQRFLNGGVCARPFCGCTRDTSQEGRRHPPMSPDRRSLSPDTVHSCGF